MRAETEIKMQKIRKVGKILKGACQGLLALTALLLVLAVYRVLTGQGFGLEALSMSVQSTPSVTAFGVTTPMDTLALPARILLASIITLTLAVQLKALLHLRNLFEYYSHGSIFTSDAVHEIRQLGITTMLWIIPNILWVAAGFIYARPQMPNSIHLQLGAVLLGMIVTFISWFMDAAADLREDNELTI